MAAYLLSLQRLEKLRQRRLREGLCADPNQTSGGFCAPSPRAENGRLAQARPGARAPTEDHKGAGIADQVGVPKEVSGFASVQELLDVPKEQIEAWLKTHGGSEARVLLAMLCRLASFGARLSLLEDRTGERKPLAPRAHPPVVSLRPNAEPDKSDLLEQVFQKNLSLRKSRMG